MEGVELPLEGAPTDGQKERLEGFLAELMLISRRYRILLRDSDGIEFVDLVRQRLIGVGLGWFTAIGDDHKVTGYLPADSILDGVWPVDTPEGVSEQRKVQNVFPRRP